MESRHAFEGFPNSLDDACFNSGRKLPVIITPTAINLDEDSVSLLLNMRGLVCSREAGSHPGRQLASVRSAFQPIFIGVEFDRSLLKADYIFLRYCPPTSNNAFVICPSEQTRTASISTSNTFLLSITAR